MTELARRVTARILYNGADVSRELGPVLTGCTFTDHAGARADELVVSFADLSRVWGGRWRPASGDRIGCTLFAESWAAPGNRVALPCGTFQICSDSFRLTGRETTIQATSVPIDTGIRRTRKTKAWENVRVREIAADVAAASGLTLLYETAVNPFYERKDQQNQSDLAFLQSVAGQFGIRVKVRPPRLILFSEAEYEQRPAVLAFTPTSPLIDAEVRRNHDAVYRGCVVAYHDPGEGKDGPKATFLAPVPPPSADLLYVTERVESQADAISAAQAHLRAANREAYTLALELPFTPELLGATVVTFTGFHDIEDGRYFVDRVTHSLAGASTSAELHRCLEGY